jgi:hypothetical protein
MERRCVGFWQEKVFFGVNGGKRAKQGVCSKNRLELENRLEVGKTQTSNERLEGGSETVEGSEVLEGRGDKERRSEEGGDAVDDGVGADDNLGGGSVEGGLEGLEGGVELGDVGGGVVKGADEVGRDSCGRRRARQGSGRAQSEADGRTGTYS